MPPYRRRRTRRRRKPRTYAQTAVRALRVANTVANMLNAERKRTELGTGTLNIANNQGPIDTLGGNITQGTSALNERVGDSLKIKLFRMRTTLQWDPVVGGVQRIRIIMFWKPEALALAGNQILDNYGTSTCTQSFIVWDNKPLIKPFFDRTYILTSEKQQVYINYKKRMEKHVKFATGTANLKTNELAIYPFSDTGAGAGTFPTCNIKLQIEYLDN